MTFPGLNTGEKFTHLTISSFLSLSIILHGYRQSGILQTPSNGRIIFIRGDFQKGANQLIYCSFIISLYNSTGTGLCITSSVIFLALTLQYRGIKPT